MWPFSYFKNKKLEKERIRQEAIRQEQERIAREQREYEEHIISKNKFQSNLTAQDVALICVFDWIGVNPYTTTFWDKDCIQSVISRSIIGAEKVKDCLDCLYKEQKYNHHLVLIQYVVKLLQQEKWFGNLFNTYLCRNEKLFTDISTYYESQLEFKGIYSQWIKPGWEIAFKTWQSISSFYITDSEAYHNYKVDRDRQFRERQRRFEQQWQYGSWHYDNQYKNTKTSQQKSLSSYFVILEIAETKDIDLVKKQYRKLAVKYHPDKGGDSEKFIKITEAYNYIIKRI